jgi:hypothetical protein
MSPQPDWIVGDAVQLDELLPDGQLYDLVFTCPPYMDLERYSSDERDLSTMADEEFFAAWGAILRQSAARLRDDRFLVVVLGEVRARSGSGAYRGLIPETIRLAAEAGLQHYNEAVLVTAVGSLPIRAGRLFQGTRKLGKTHQNVLMFLKGDVRRAVEAIGEVETASPQDASRVWGEEEAEEALA